MDDSSVRLANQLKSHLEKINEMNITVKPRVLHQTLQNLNSTQPEFAEEK